jgi:hypothetical protein
MFCELNVTKLQDPTLGWSDYAVSQGLRELDARVNNSLRYSTCAQNATKSIPALPALHNWKHNLERGSLQVQTLNREKKC